MHIAILGAGNVGTALAIGWQRAGHTVVFGVRDPQQRPATRPAGVTSATLAQAARAGEVVVLATPWPAVPDALAAVGDLTGKTLIDCTNPLRFGPAGLELEIGHDTSGAERVAVLARGAAVFKTLNQTGFDNMAHAAEFTVLPAAMYVAGDDVERKPVVLRLVADLGFQAIDAGGLAISRLLEPMAMLWIHLALNRGEPMTTAFAMSRRS